MSYRARFALFVLSAVVLLFVFDTAYQGFKTLKRLDVIEAERDQWQRPSAIIGALNLAPGNVVADLGSGSGYLALKLSSEVGPSGKVLAIDIRRLSLAFLWVRALMKRQRNIEEMRVEADDPRLPANTVNAVLILNTYHEMANPRPILDQIFRSLVSGGRLVVVDPEQTEHGENQIPSVEDELRRHGFDILRRDDRFIEQSAAGRWWLIIARRP